MSSGNICKYEFLTGKDVLPETDLLEKSVTIKRLEYPPSGSDMKKQTDIVKDQYKFFKDQINVNNNNREDNIKTEDGDGRVEVVSGEKVVLLKS